MKRLVIVMAILGVLVTSTVTTIAVVQAQKPQNTEEGEVETFAHTVRGIIRGPLASIDNKLDNVLEDTSSLKATVSETESDLQNPEFGLAEIKKEVRFIENNVTSPDFGLQEIKSETSTIENEVLSQDHGLVEISNGIDGLKNILTAEDCTDCNFVYVVKYTCSDGNALAGLVNVPDGRIITVINVYNFQPSTVNADVSVVGLSALGQSPDTPSSTSTAISGERGLYISCSEIEDIVGPRTGEGFVIIETEEELEVVSVYSGGGVKRSSGRALSFGMDVQIIEPHLVPRSSGSGGA